MEVRKFVIVVVAVLGLGVVIVIANENLDEDANAWNANMDLPLGNSILYVGSIGPNNYTKIQDAIDDAYDGVGIF